MPHLLTPDNYHEAQAGIRDILYLYVEMAEGCSGFGHAVDATLRYGALLYVDALIEAKARPCVDRDLLQRGSAIALLCRLYDWWAEEQDVDNPDTAPTKQALAEGRLAHLPDIEAVMREAFRRDWIEPEDPWFDEAVEAIYRTHVLGYFAHLSRQVRD